MGSVVDFVWGAHAYYDVITMLVGWIGLAAWRLIRGQTSTVGSKFTHISAERWRMESVMD